MKDFHAYTLENWPRRTGGDLIFTTANEAIYYANLVEDSGPAYQLLKRWRANTSKEIKYAREWRPINYNRIFELSMRGQFYREAMEEIERLAMEGP